MLTARQEKILDTLIKEYIDKAEPISSKLLKKECALDVSPATIRNDLQELADEGYITQPHTSAGRVPSEKAYKYFVHKIFQAEEENFCDFIFKEAEEVRQKIVKELELVRELDRYLTGMIVELSHHHLEADSIFEILTIIGPSKTNYDKNVNLFRDLLKEFEDF